MQNQGMTLNCTFTWVRISHIIIYVTLSSTWFISFLTCFTNTMTYYSYNHMWKLCVKEVHENISSPKRSLKQLWAWNHQMIRVHSGNEPNWEFLIRTGRKRRKGIGHKAVDTEHGTEGVVSWSVSFSPYEWVCSAGMQWKARAERFQVEMNHESPQSW